MKIHMTRNQTDFLLIRRIKLTHAVSVFRMMGVSVSGRHFSLISTRGVRHCNQFLEGDLD
jgi:hypothetical protein